MEYWIVPCNTNIYDIDKAINTNSGYCWWRQDNNFAIGDVVFVYIGKPVEAIRYRMVVTAVGVKETEELMSEKLWVDKSIYYETLGLNMLARFEVKEKYSDEDFPLSELLLHGHESSLQSVQIISRPFLDFLLNDNPHTAISDIDPAGNPDSATDYTADDNLWEGAIDKTLVNHYERNRNAREQCIKAHGYRCAICGFDFEKAYGTIGHNYIHIHHIVPISSIGKGYRINPEQDLIPVCPNCHAMLHSKPGKHNSYTPEELRKILQECHHTLRKNKNNQ